MRLQLATAMIIVACMQVGCTLLPNQTVKMAADTKVPVETNNTTTEITYTNASAPARIAVIWKADVLRFAGQQPTHGFTGRLYFYDSKDQLLEVDGELTVYGYDDSLSKVSRVADNVYKFPADKFKQHYDASELGHSYSVWIPWPDKDRYRKSISLVPKFTTSNGETLMGMLNRLVLPGDPPPNENAVQKTVVNSSMFPAVPMDSSQKNYEQAARRGVDTIQIPDALAKKIANAPQNRVPSREVLQHLSDMESPELNPNGELYNRSEITQRQYQVDNPPVVPKNPQANLNFSDTPVRAAQMPLSQIEAPKNEPPVRKLGTFGKPGVFR